MQASQLAPAVAGFQRENRTGYPCPAPAVDFEEMAESRQTLLHISPGRLVRRYVCRIDLDCFAVMPNSMLRLLDTFGAEIAAPERRDANSEEHVDSDRDD